VQHIHADSHVESQGEALQRLMRQLGLREADMFRSAADMEREAYEKQEQRIAYTTVPVEPAEHLFKKSVSA
jgi:hypothetical protein